MSTVPAFRKLAAPLDITDTELDTLNAKLGVPTLVTTTGLPAPTQPVARSVARQRSINIMMPDYAAKALKERAHQNDTSVRYVVLKALRDAGLPIAEADLVEDARRSKS